MNTNASEPMPVLETEIRQLKNKIYELSHHMCSGKPSIQEEENGCKGNYPATLVEIQRDISDCLILQQLPA
jgi:hypothetical protein